MVVLDLISAFGMGALLGMFWGLYWGSKPSQPQTHKSAFLPWKRPPKAPERKAPNVTSFPRNVGSWRKQRKELERQHNSQQKMRDRGMASL